MEQFIWWCLFATEAETNKAVYNKTMTDNCHKRDINKQRCSNNRRNNFLAIELSYNLPSSTTDFTSFHKFDKSLNNNYQPASAFLYACAYFVFWGE